MNSIPWLVALPLGMGFLLPLMPKRAVRISDLLANLTTMLLVIISLSLIGHSDVYHMGGWAAPVGIVLVLDGLSGFMLVVVAVVSLAATFFSMRYMDQYTAKPKYYGLFLLMVAGMNGAILTGDIFNLYVFLEIAAVARFCGLLLHPAGCRASLLGVRHGQHGASCRQDCRNRGRGACVPNCHLLDYAPHRRARDESRACAIPRMAA